MSKQYIYTIAYLTKKHGQREVLKDIWLAFYPGAKIGVLGRNGAGKCTLLRIMAGQDTEFDGEARLTEGFTVATCRRNRSSIRTRTCAGNVEEAVAARRATAWIGTTRLTCGWRSRWSRRDGEAVRRAGPGPGPDRRQRPVGAGSRNRNRDGRHEPAARGCRRDEAVRW